MQRSWVPLVIVCAMACGKKQEEARPVVDKGSAKAPGDTAPPPSAAPKKIDGPSVTPVASASVAFVVPKSDTSWWGELNFACYRAAMSLTGTRTAGEAFEQLSPTVPAAMAAAGVDLGRDLAALGGFDCGGSPCLYAVASLAKPEAMPELLKTLLPSAPQKTIAPGHYIIDTPSTRTIHVRVVPLQWTTVPSGNAWNTEAARATHVVFIIGVDGKNLDVDPLAHLADAEAALANVKDAEAVVGDPRDRCIVGRVGPTEFQPGYKLDRARFAMTAAPGKGDALMALLESQRTLDFTVELTLSPAPKNSHVKSWIQQGRAWAGNVAGPIRLQFAGNPMVDVYIDMLALLGNRGFKYELKDKALRFSWRTDRVPRGELDALETRFQALMGTQP